MESIFTVKINFVCYQLMLICFLGQYFVCFCYLFLSFLFTVKVSNFFSFFLIFLKNSRSDNHQVLHDFQLNVDRECYGMGSFFPTFR